MEDCPICYEKLVEGNDNCAMSGTNCEHKFCIPCYCKIIEDNKCAICRARLEENESDDSDDENIYTGTNQRPTTNLFLGRRWLNTETNKIEYFYCFINENGLYNAWIDIEKKNFSTFIQRYINVGNIEGCCYICGIQRTAEVNEFMKIKYPIGFVNLEGDEWDDYFLDSSWHNNCYECSNMYHKLNQTFYG
jgi:hypothetical protein